MPERNQDPLPLVANHQMTPSHFNAYQSSYNNPQFQQQFSPSQSPHYGSTHPTQYYSTTYPSTPRAITYPSTPVTVQPVHRRQSSFANGTSGTTTNISGTEGNNSVCIMPERNQDPLPLVANHQMTPSHFNAYQSSYNNPQFQQQFSPSQSPHYGSTHPTQYYSTTYPSTPRAITYPSTPYPNAYSSTVH
nr:hypothetical protein [Tanacetum cinerariifolium]